jgi:hypothetical protein
LEQFPTAYYFWWSSLEFNHFLIQLDH